MRHEPPGTAVAESNPMISSIVFGIGLLLFIDAMVRPQSLRPQESASTQRDREATVGCLLLLFAGILINV